MLSGYAGVNSNVNFASVNAESPSQWTGQSSGEQLQLNPSLYQRMALQSQLRGMQRENVRLGAVGTANANLGWSQNQQLQQQQQQTVQPNWAQQYGDISTEQFGDIGDNSNVQQKFGSIGAQDWQQQQQQQQQPIGLGVSAVDMVNLQQPVTLSQIPQYQQQQQQQRVGLASAASVMPNYQQPIIAGAGEEEESQNNIMLGYASNKPQLKQQQLQDWQQQQQFGGVGKFGAGTSGGASKKTTTAQPIYAQSMVVPKIITQPVREAQLHARATAVPLRVLTAFS